MIHVPGWGNKYTCKYILIGEAPGKTEEKLKTPFVGRAGKFLKKTLSSQGIDESEVYFTNAVKINPGSNKSPTKKETREWVPLLLREINDILLKNQKVEIIACGKVAQYALSKLLFQHHCIMHPAYVMRFKKTEEWIKQIQELKKTQKAPI